MILLNIKKFSTLLTTTFLKTLNSISSSGTGGHKFLKTWISSYDNISGTLIGPVFQVTIQVKRRNSSFYELKTACSRGANTFNVFKKVLVTSVQNFLTFDMIILKILGIIKSH